LVLPAAEDLARFSEHIERDNPEAARRVARIIYDGCARLKDYPRLGRARSRMAGQRELVFSPLPYIAVYQVMDYAVEISRIFHGAQDWPWLSPPTGTEPARKSGGVPLRPLPAGPQEIGFVALVSGSVPSARQS